MFHPSTEVLLIIFLNYLIYAGNVLRIALKHKVDRRRIFAFGWLSFVFVFCGLCHLTGVLDGSWWTVRESLYWFLAFLSCGLNFSNQAVVMAEMLGKKEM